MPSNPDSQFAFRDAELAEVYDKSFGRDRRHEAAKARLKRWEIAHRFLLKEISLTLEEAQILHYLVSSAKTYVENSLENMQINLQLLKMSVVDGLEDYPELAIVLAEKIESWSTAHWYAVLDACDRVGGGAYHVKSIAEELKRVGLV